MAHKETEKKKRNKLEKLLKEIEIIPAKPIKFDGERYLAYCDFGHHQGMITDIKKYIECVHKHCPHLYVKKIGR